MNNVQNSLSHAAHTRVFCLSLCASINRNRERTRGLWKGAVNGSKNTYGRYRAIESSFRLRVFFLLFTCQKVYVYTLC